MRKRPTSVKIGHMLYEIIWSSEKADERAQEGRICCGWSSPAFGVIVVRDDLPPDAESDTLLHEILHQCLAASGCEPATADTAEGMEEWVVWAMTGPLLTVLRENPDVLKFLINNKSKPKE